MSRKPISISIAPSPRPTFVLDSPPPYHLQIDNVENIPHVLRNLQADPDRAKGITNVVICEAEEEDEYSEAEEIEPSDQEALPQDSAEPISKAEADSELETGHEDNNKAGTLVAELLDEVSGGLDAFQWTGPNAWSGQQREGKRPALFWKALWKCAEKLQAINLQFFDHELHELHLAQDDIPPCPNFPKLELAFLDASRAHGDDGSFLDCWLRRCPALQVLDLQLPNCDLETCQIRGMTWDYDLPVLEKFGLRGYSLNTQGLASFLRRNSTLKTLTLDLSTEEPFRFLPNTLPNLESLSIDFNGRPKLVEETMPGLAATPLRHLRINGCPHSSYLELGALSNSLRCLELDLGSGWRNHVGTIGGPNDGDAPANTGSTTLPKLPEIIKTLLQRLPNLQELALGIETGNTTIYEGSGDESSSRYPEAMCESDSKSALQLLGPDSQVRALRISDSRGIPLTAQLLDDIPGAPPSLEYVKWETGTKNVLYRLQRDGEHVRAVECEPPTRTRANGFWTENRVLDFENPA